MTNTVASIVAAIFLVEGGTGASVAYGIKSVKVSSKEQARKVCERTVVNSIKAWEKNGKNGCALIFLADRYCPAKTDPVGNRNWKRNIKILLHHKQCNCNASAVQSK